MKAYDIDLEDLSHDIKGHLAQFILGLKILEKIQVTEGRPGTSEICQIIREQALLEQKMKGILAGISKKKRSA